MPLLIFLTTLAVVCGLLRYAVNTVLHRRKAAALGCQEPYVRTNSLPLGIDTVYALVTAEKAGRLMEFNAAMFQEGRRTVKVNFLGSSVVMTMEPKNIQALLATQFHDYGLGHIRRQSLGPMFGNGIFTADGKSWEHSRALLRPQFAREQIADLELEEEHMQDLLQLLRPHDDGWTDQTSICPMFFRLTFDSATEFLFGMNIRSQRQAGADPANQSKLPEWTSLAQNFDAGTIHVGRRHRLLDLYWLHYPKELRDNIKEVHRFADYCVQEALERHSQPEPGPDPLQTKPQARKYTFLDELVKVTQDPIELRSQLLNILIAGRDTTAGLLSWTFWLLGRHPHVFRRLRAAILEDFGPYSQRDRITFTTLKSCTYLRHVLNEVLRLYPPLPANSRVATKDTTIPLGGGPDGQSPVFVKKGQPVAYIIHSTHRMQEVWGDDADDFNPDRWVGRKTGWEYLPFNGGPRICLGQQFALTEAGYVITRMVQRFDDLRLEDEKTEPTHRFGLADAPRDYFIAFHEAR